MAATPADVRAINGSTADDPAIQPYLDSAACVLAQISGCMDAQSISTDCQDDAQAWLTAHLMAVTAPHAGTLPNKSEKFESYSVNKMVAEFSGEGVLSTGYGQTANGITGGCLQEVNKAPLQIAFFG